MMPILWHRFAEDSNLPSALTAGEQTRLTEIFNPDDAGSVWRRALALIGLPQPPLPKGLLSWYRDVPYINWNAMTHLVSGGGLIPEAEGQYRYRYTPATMWGMLKAQWRLARYTHACLDTDAPPAQDNDAQLAESLALGFCILALTLRIPSKNASLLQDGLADPATIPPRLRTTIAQIKALQQRRNQLSAAWHVLFPVREATDTLSPVPEFFWDQPPAEIAPPEHSAPSVLPTHWQGISIAGEAATGRPFLVRTKADAEKVRASNARWVLIFPMAKPDSTELFAYATAVLYAQGGTMSHAASIAREQNLTSLTGLGKPFLEDIAQHLALQPDLILQVDPARKRVECVA